MRVNFRAEAVAMLRQAMTTAGAPADTANAVAIAAVDQLIRNGWRPPEPPDTPNLDRHNASTNVAAHAAQATAALLSQRKDQQ